MSCIEQSFCQTDAAKKGEALAVDKYPNTPNKSRYSHFTQLEVASGRQNGRDAPAVSGCLWQFVQEPLSIDGPR